MFLLNGCQDSLENYFGQAIGRRKDNPSLHDIGYNDNTIRNQFTYNPMIGTNSLDNNPEPKRNYHVEIETKN